MKLLRDLVFLPDVESLAVVDSPVLACADLGDHVVDLWEEESGWCCGNDDRSVVVKGAPDADAVLDDYRHALALANGVAADESTFTDPFARALRPIPSSLAEAVHALGECSDPNCECHD